MQLHIVQFVCVITFQYSDSDVMRRVTSLRHSASSCFELPATTVWELRVPIVEEGLSRISGR